MRTLKSVEKSTKNVVTRIKDAGIAICNSEEGYFSILQGPEMGWRGWANVSTHTQKEVVPKKEDTVLL